MGGRARRRLRGGVPLRHPDRRRRGARSAHPWRSVLVISVLTAIGLLGKESAVVLPAVLAAYVLAAAAADAFRGTRAMVRDDSPDVVSSRPPLAIVAIYWIVRTAVYGTPTDAYGGLGGTREARLRTRGRC